MNKATAAWSEPAPTYHRPTLRVLSTPRPQVQQRSRALTPVSVGLGLALWTGIISMVWLLV
jgi:hypothetical protein